MTKRTLFTAATLAAALAAGPVMAQETQPQLPVPPGHEATQSEKNALLVGKPVWTTDGKEVGLVSEVLTGPDGEIVALHVTIGDFLGIGERMVRVAAELVAADGERLQVMLTADEMGMLPEVSRNA